MTIKELIRELRKVEDKNMQVTLVIQHIVDPVYGDWQTAFSSLTAYECGESWDGTFCLTTEDTLVCNSKTKTISVDRAASYVDFDTDASQEAE